MRRQVIVGIDGDLAGGDAAYGRHNSGLKKGNGCRFVKMAFERERTAATQTEPYDPGTIPGGREAQ